MTQDTLRKIAEWAVGDDTGASSKFLARCALGIDNANHTAIPYDAGDFGRCYRFAKLLDPTELTNALVRATWQVEKWKILREHWSELAELYHECFEAYEPGSTRFYKLWKELGL